MTNQQQEGSATTTNSTHSLGIELTPDCHPPSIEVDALHRTGGLTNSDNNEINGGPSTAPHNTAATSKSQTTALDAWIQLTKAYIGPGCLSLPWAISRLGLPVGTSAIFIVAVWTSYNAWNVVALKRIIVKERSAQQQSLQQSHSNNNNNDNSNNPQQPSTINSSLQVNYADVGEWAYNTKFKDVLLVSICVQQLAVCTVFLSFIGENIAAVMERTLVEEGEMAPSHAFVITLALPFALLLSCLPNLKVLTPVMVVASMSLFVGFGLLGVVIAAEWEHRPSQPDVILYDIEWGQVPTAICAILYSYEGICVCLPIESAMAKPQQFKTVFVTSMSFTAVVFAAVAALCVIAFGDVTSGSVTAFLVETLDGENVKWWLYMANTFCSLAVLLTYPLQLFPSFELIGPWLTRVLRLDLGTHVLVSRSGAARRRLAIPDNRTFSPVPSYEDNNPDDRVIGNHDYHNAERISASAPTSSCNGGASSINNNATTSSTAEHHLPSEQSDPGVPPNTAPSAVESEEEIEIGDTIPFLAAFPTPGDSPQLRAILVCFTYVMAIAIPNVQLLVSLAGALSGSATGLIIPPLLMLAHIKRQEDELYRSITDPDYDDDYDDGNDGDAYNDEDNNTTDGDGLTRRSSPSGSPPSSRWSLQWKKRECYVLFGLGVVVCVFGTGAALLDIFKVYLGR